MHVVKVRQLEELGWYRENSVRYFPYWKPSNIARFSIVYAVLPFMAHKLGVVCKEIQVAGRGEPHSFKTIPWIPYEYRAGGHPPDYNGVEESRKYSKYRIVT